MDYLRRHYKMQEITSYFLDQLPTFINEVESQIIANDLSVCEQKRVLRLPAQRRKIYVMSRFEAYIVSGYFRLSRIICPYCRKSFVYQSERNP